MKIRRSFVSNSSTSSFVIAFKDADLDKCPHCGRSDVSPVDLVQRGDNSLTWLATPEDSESLLTKWGKEEVKCKGEINVAQYDVDHTPKKRDETQCRNRFAYDTPKYRLANLKNRLEFLQNRTRLVKEALADGCTIVEIEVSNHDHFVRESIQAMKDGGKIKILDGDY